MSENIRETDYVKIMREPEARIALCKCKETKKIYGVRMEKSQEGWNCTWAFPISEESATREGYATTILKGCIGHKPEYNGCPYCGVKVFIVCGSCKRLNCNTTASDLFTCEWCGSTGRLTVYGGAGVESGGDR